MKAPYFANIALLLLLQGFALAAEPASPPAPGLEKRPDELNVSIIQLIANPGAFDGKYVAVGGYLDLSDEYENSLFLDENSSRAGMSANSIAIDLDQSSSDIQTQMHSYDQHYVIIAGKFEHRQSIFSGGRLVAVYRVIRAN
jgi:hypothetical protein